MRIRMISVALTTTALFFVHTAKAQSVPTISVRGDAEVLVAPDEARIVFGVELIDKELEAGGEKMEATVKGLLAAIEKQDIEKRHIQTDTLDLRPIYTNNYGEPKTFQGYQHRRSLLLTVKNLDKLEAILADALRAGANYVHSVSFHTSELRMHRDEARALALRAAREKARDMAEELDARIGYPTHISEGYTQARSWYSGSWGGGHWNSGLMQNVSVATNSSAFEGQSSTIAPGQISVTAQVEVTFELLHGVKDE